MKKLLNILVATSAVMALTACGGGGSNGDYNGGGGGGSTGPESLYAVDVSNLDQGFIIYGSNRAGESVTLKYCGRNYEYASGSGYWYGHFNINGDRINMFDDTPTGGSYRIDTGNYTLEVGVEYFIDFQNDEILVDQITEDLYCN
jgi:hypothetical protein